MSHNPYEVPEQGDAEHQAARGQPLSPQRNAPPPAPATPTLAEELRRVLVKAWAGGYATARVGCTLPGASDIRDGDDIPPLLEQLEALIDARATAAPAVQPHVEEQPPQIKRALRYAVGMVKTAAPGAASVYDLEQRAESVLTALAAAESAAAEARGERDRLQAELLNEHAFNEGYQEHIADLRDAMQPFASLVKETEGRIPAERLSFADWHKLAKAYEAAAIALAGAGGKDGGK